jgi:SAM-dependent methyltransferase
VTDLNPQAAQMADESMLRNLAAQATAIWPQEQALFARYGLSGAVTIADIGCGSGEITARLAAMYVEAQLLGIDVLESVLAHARQKHAHLAPRVRFESGDAFHLASPDDAFDLVVCRHLTQAVPQPARVLAELARICKRGGFVHVLSEDYGMLHIPGTKLDPDRLWYDGIVEYDRRTGTDARIGRRTLPLMQDVGLTDIRVDYAIVDTIRVPRTIFAGIIAAWRDGYSDHVGDNSLLDRATTRALFDQAIATILDPTQYAVWHVPILSGRKQQALTKFGLMKPNSAS